MLGWVIALAIVGTIVLFAASGADASESGQPATWVAVVEIALGSACSHWWPPGNGAGDRARAMRPRSGHMGPAVAHTLEPLTLRTQYGETTILR